MPVEVSHLRVVREQKSLQSARSPPRSHFRLLLYPQMVRVHCVCSYVLHGDSCSFTYFFDDGSNNAHTPRPLLFLSFFLFSLCHFFLLSLAWTQEMHQLNSAKDEAREKQQEEQRDERTGQEEVLSSFDFASCTEQYSTPLPLLKYENVTTAQTTARLTREVECVQRNGSYYYYFYYYAYYS